MGKEGQMTIESSDLELQFKPVFSEEERSLILTKWDWEKRVANQKKEVARIEEERLTKIETSEEMRALVRKYQDIFKSNQGLHSISSADETLVLLRHAIFTKVVNIQTQNGFDEVEFRRRVTAITDRDIEMLRLKRLIIDNFGNYQLAIAAAFPTLDLQVIEFEKVPYGFWEIAGKEKYLEAIRWWLERYLKIPKEVPEDFRLEVISLRFGKMLGKLLAVSRRLGYKKIAEAVVDAYPELKLREWEFVFGVAWEDPGSRQKWAEAVRWLTEERLGINPEDSAFVDKLLRIRERHFSTAGLSYLWRIAKSHTHLVKEAYPELELPDNAFYRFPIGYWQGEGARERAVVHIRDLVERKLGRPNDPDFRGLLKGIKLKDFYRAGLGGMLAAVFNYSRFEAIQAAYPELDLQEWEVSIPKGFWTEGNYKNVIRAVGWLVKKKGLERDRPDFKSGVLHLTHKDFIENGLSGIFPNSKLDFLKVLQLSFPELNITLEEYIASNGYRAKALGFKLTGTNKDRQLSTEEANKWLSKFLREDGVE